MLVQIVVRFDDALLAVLCSICFFPLEFVMRSVITAAIRQCVLDWPRIATTLLRIDPRPKDGIGTIAADKNLRLYYDPEWLKEQSFDDIVFWIKQEILPPLLRHPERCQAILGKTSGPLRRYVQEKLNIASDLCVYEFMEAEKQKISDAAITPWNAVSCKTGTSLQPGLSLEEYFHHVYDESEIQDIDQEPDPSGDHSGDSPGGDSPGGSGDGDGDGDGSNPISSGHAGGSGTDGESREWDDDYSDTKLGDDHNSDSSGSGGVGDDEIDDLTEDFLKGCNGRSSYGREGRALEARFSKPKVSPEQLLRMAVKAGVEERRHGHEEPTYRRPSRRRSDSEFIRPSYQKRNPKITIVIDTSASMRAADISLGCGMVKTALDDMKLSSVRVISADTQINTDMDIRNVADIKLKGYGGTCMDEVCDEVAEDRKNESSLIICVTDGETPWPTSRRVPIVAAITRKCSDYYTRQMPSHIRKVELYAS
jgi:predicted metal-dependent peptidase